MHPSVLIMGMLASIPLSAIIGSYVMKYKKMTLEGGGLTNEDKLKIDKILNENQQLRGRVENLESIVTTFDKELLMLKASDDNETEKIQKQISELAQKLK